MPTEVVTTAPRVAGRPPAALAWVVLLTSASATILTGGVFTVLILSDARARMRPMPAAFWGWVFLACGLTVASLMLRALRWCFLLRRAEIRIPIRDAYIGYFAGLSLLFVPFLLGEITVRSLVQRSRNGVPIATTCVVNLWDRFLDVAALTAIAVIAAVRLAEADWWTTLLLAVFGLCLVRPVRVKVLSLAAALGTAVDRRIASGEGRFRPRDLERLTSDKTWLMALAASIAAWMLPVAAFWGLANSWGAPFGFAQAQQAFSSSALKGMLVLAPGGVLVVGGNLLTYLTAHGLAAGDAALTVLGVRAATAGLATALGVIFVGMHLRSHPGLTASHFDAIAHAYDAQIPEARRLALVARKSELMSRALRAHGTGPRGLDVGCGQGWYVARMRHLGFDVEGIDDSPHQVDAARRHVEPPGVVALGSALRIAAPDGSFDFAYCINVLHHLESVADQRAAFAEVLRVVRAGGLLFVHEINTRNLLFRFYMGYVFPSLNCIDEGVERWLLPHRLAAYTDSPVLGIEYFTFLPEFMPSPAVRLLTPLERLLEASPLRVYSAHYMAVLQKR
jgi:2-polyprenyl-3-methyl-5-hydroxy-6-metoxy-1,4-benzoquinol methylase/uncharacterized membrane protein YbhN (UPF0104 family)